MMRAPLLSAWEENWPLHEKTFSPAIRRKVCEEWREEETGGTWRVGWGGWGGGGGGGRFKLFQLNIFVYLTSCTMYL